MDGSSQAGETGGLLTGEVGVPDGLRRAVAELGLSVSEAGVLLGLLRLGTATAPQLATVAGIAPTNTYRVLENLQERRLVHRLPSPGAAVWGCQGAEEVLERIERAHREQTERLRGTLTEWAAPRPPVDAPQVQVIHDPADAASTYEQLVESTERELLIFTRPPYSTAPKPVRSVLNMLARGCEVRAIYETGDAAELDAQGALAPYHQAGVQGRIIDRLPLKMAIFDRRTVLVSILNTDLPTIGFPTTLHIEHSGYAETLIPGFEQLWTQARPFKSSTQAAAEVGA